MQAKKVQFWVVVAGSLLMAVKFAAHFITNSDAILSDALESIINVAAGFFALYSIHLASKPKDLTHPYGHGKIEFVSAAFEGGLIVLAAIYISFESVMSFIFPHPLQKLDIGIWLTAGSGLVNLLLSWVLVRTGKKNYSAAMIADGKHLLTDTYTSVGLLIGLGLVYYTGLVWIDALIAFGMGIIILITGLRLIRTALAGLLDETDQEIISLLVEKLNKYRKPEWIDVHNMRIVRHGAAYHIDAHVTLPWYWSLEQAHEELTIIDKTLSSDIPNETEFFIHADPCLPFSCSLCSLKECKERKRPFERQIEWNTDTIIKNEKHALN